MFLDLKVFALAIMVLFVGSVICPPPAVSHHPTSNESCLKNCPVTADYTPFCGSDNQTHVTHGLLTCYQRCNIPITVAYEGRCSWDTPDPTIRIPVADSTSTIKTPVA
ncbi:uncharacterized protein LOC135838790 [Planococcus citri]|uniref:uncharacterized protein LOC135838790 n=1 Tax=Planococcus citri TaxID=170843 RepID=UPI0031F97041